MENWNKVLVIGAENVGKTSILQHLCEEEEVEFIQKTLGMSVHVRIDQNDESKITEYYELGGSAANIDELAETYMQTQNFDGVMAVFDLYNTKTIDSLIHILEKFYNATLSQHEAGIEEGYGFFDFPLQIVGNK